MTLPEMYLPEIRSYQQVVARARDKVSRTALTRVAFVAPTDENMLAACERAVHDGLIELTIIGDAAAFRAQCTQQQVDVTPTRVFDVPDMYKAVLTTADLAAQGEIDLIVKGKILTAELLSILFRHEMRFVGKGSFVSHVAVTKPERYKKLLMVTDPAVMIEPDLQHKLALIGNVVRVARSIGIVNPRIALLAAVEVVYPQMPVTMEAAVISKMAERGQIKDAIIDGPLSLDCAVDMFAAHSKGVKYSPVAGQADALLAPNIETANGIYKAMALYGECEMGGVIVGGKVPIALGSRSDTTTSKFNSIVLGVLAA
ncbi:MAG: phosphate acyltransferase [Candidatus Zixiibacteriota bacterium]